MIRKLQLLAILLLAVCALAGATSPGRGLHWNAARGYAPFVFSTPSGIRIANDTCSTICDGVAFPSPVNEFSISFRASNLSSLPSGKASFRLPGGKKASRRFPEWRLYLLSSASDTLFISFKTIEKENAIDSEAAMRVSASRSGLGHCGEKVITDGLDLFTGANTWILSSSGGGITLSGGNRELKKILDISGSNLKFTGFGFAASPGCTLLITDITFTDRSTPSMVPHPVWENPEAMQRRFAVSEDPMEGYWVMFDRTLDESLLMPGGDYRLAIVKDNAAFLSEHDNGASIAPNGNIPSKSTTADSQYLIIYLSGAVKNASQWQPGMVKGRLVPDSFPGIFSLIWYDADGSPLSHGLKAQRGDGETLLLQFPYQQSSLRLRKLPPAVQN